MIGDIAAGQISIKYGFRGPNFGTVSACASSTNALIEAFNYIRMGKAVAVVSGGSEMTINPPGMGGFNSMQALSTNNAEYKTASRPFCKTRDGFVMGEGGASIVLEEYEHAVARGAKIYAEVVGYGTNCDAYHITAPNPEGEGGAKCMALAVKDAGLEMTDVDYINAHGTSTSLNDAGETLAIKKAFGDHAYKLMVSSTKSMTGHLLGAAGAVEGIITSLALRDGFVPATINYREKDEACDLDIVPNEGRKADIKVALSNALGFGGHNASIVFRRYECN